LTGPGTPAQFQAALRAVTYRNTSDNPSTAGRTVSFQVNDGAAANNLSNTATRTITVTAVNDPPTVANPIPNQTFTGAGVKSFASAATTFADAENDPLTYSAALVGGGSLPAWLTFTPGTRTFSGNPSVADTTPLMIQVTADDGHGGTVPATFQLTLS